MGQAQPFSHYIAHRAASASCSITMDPITGSVKLLTPSGKEANIFQMIGYLFVAGAYSLNRFFTGAADKELSPEEFLKHLDSAKVEVKEDEYGRYYLAISDTDISKEEPLTAGIEMHSQAAPSPQPEPVVVRNKDGSVIYQIQNLNIYITAEVITQLNMNPEKVINMIQDKLELEIQKAAKK